MSLFIAALLLVAAIGYLAQTTGLCMVRGVGEARDAARPLIVVENWLEELKTLVQQ